MGFDRNAQTKTRFRRNAQQEGAGQVTALVKVVAPLFNSGTQISLPVATNAVNGYLSSADWSTFNNKVSTTRTISTTAPITGGGDLSANRTIAMAAATGSVDGYLAHADWTNFNGKLSAVVNGDTSIAVTGGNSITVNLATSSGLQISSGLSIKPGGVGSNRTIGTDATGVFVLLADAALQASSSGITFNSDNNCLARTGISSAVQVIGFKHLSSDPGTPISGEMWFNTTMGAVKENLISAGGNSLPSILVSGFYTGSNSSTVTTTAAKTTFTPTVTIPAGGFNFMGRAIRATAILGGNGLAGDTFTLSLNWGSTLIWSKVITGNIISNLWVELLITCTSTGATGQLLVLGKTFNGSNAYAASNALTTVDLTTAQTLSFAGQWSSASASDAAQLSFWCFELLG